MKFNELSNKLINGFELYIYLIESNIDNGKNLKTKPVDSSIQSKQIVFCSQLPSGILSFNSYLDLYQRILFLLVLKQMNIKF